LPGDESGEQLAILTGQSHPRQQVWAALREIPYGETVSYGELAGRLAGRLDGRLAGRLDRPKAVRAVANANGANRLAILVPCHRVVGKDGSLTGYGGGLWRKGLLLELERTGRLPGHGFDPSPQPQALPTVITD